jgi:3-oxoacyl-[acyl-carrier protein] reductase
MKNILITGASRGIGKACALTFAKAGYQVFLNCRSSLDEIESVQKEILSNGGKCHVLMGDVSNPNDVKEIFLQIERICKGLDVLINNAGISYVGLLNNMAVDEWNQVIATNLSSAFYCSKLAIPYMIHQKSGKIINISSIWGRFGASCEVAYSTSKAGLDGFTKALSKELAPSNIQVNSISCGIIDTQMNHGFSKDELKSLIEDIPASRFGGAFEVADLALDLASKHSYLTGQIIGLDGGF